MERYIIALVAVIILFYFTCFLVSAITYLYGEIIHTIKNFKRSTREMWWNLEWKWNHR